MKVWYTLQSLQLYGFYVSPFCIGDGHQTAQHSQCWSHSRDVPGFSEIALKTQVLTERLIETGQRINTLEPRNSVCLNSLSCLCILCDCGPTWSRAYCFKSHTKWEKRSFCQTEEGQRTQRTKEEDKELAWGDMYMRETPVIWKSYRMYEWDLNITENSTLS